MPNPTDPSGRAVWAAALINPLPGLGVAREIRPAVLSATGDSRRQLEIVEGAIAESRGWMRSGQERYRRSCSAAAFLMVLVAVLSVRYDGWPLSAVFPGVVPYARWVGESSAVRWLSRGVVEGGAVLKASSPTTSEL